MLSYRAFVSGVNRAFQHKGGIKTLCLGTLEREWFADIQRECSWIISTAGSSDVTEKAHVTNWTRPTGQVRQFS